MQSVHDLAQQVLDLLPRPVLLATDDGRVVCANLAARSLFADRLEAGVSALFRFGSESPGAERPGSVWRGQAVDKDGWPHEVTVSRVSVSDAECRSTFLIQKTSPHVESATAPGNLLSFTAHQLRGLLATLEMSLELLSRGAGSPRVPECQLLLDKALGASRRIHGVVDNWLSLQNITACRLAIDPRPTDPSALLGEALEVVGPELELRGQPLHRALPSVQVMADPFYAAQALGNLLTNASRYSGDGQPIQVTGAQAAGFVHLAVRDQGPGIPPEEQTHIFEPFYRAPAQRGTPGFGLGLAVVQAVAEAHGGSAGVETRRGAGSRFWFTLPEVAGANGEPR